jgi:hypothetical protein
MNQALDSAKASKMRWNGCDIPVPFPFTLCEFAGYFERVGGQYDSVAFHRNFSLSLMFFLCIERCYDYCPR